LLLPIVIALRGNEPHPENSHFRGKVGFHAQAQGTFLKEQLVQIEISARHGNLSERTQAAITEKVEKLTRIFERLTAIEVTVNLEHRDKPDVDLRVSAEHKHDFVATAGGDDLMVSLDQVVEKMEQQLRKYKERLHDRHRTGSARQVEVGTEPATE